MNLADVLLNSVRRYPEKLAFICEDIRLTYKTFNERVNRLANSFRVLGLGRENHIALLSRNCHLHSEMFFAAAKTGVVFIPLNYRLSPRELIYIINDSESRILFFCERVSDLVRTIQKDLKGLSIYICTDDKINEILSYEQLLTKADTSEPLL